MRLDALLCERGLFESRSRAAAAVLAGEVRVGGDGARAAKPGQLVARDVELAVDEVPRFVSRGGIKLANALAASGLEVAGRRCLDVGASTGGFTDCLLAAGAAHVVALDVAYGELSWRLRGDPRVTRDRALQRPRPPAGRAALRSRGDRRRRLVHLAAHGARRRCSPAPRRASTRSRWSSRSSRSVAPRGSRRRRSRRGAAARRAAGGRRRRGAARGLRARVPQLRAARARRATSRPSSSWPRAPAGWCRGARPAGAGGRPG